MRNLFTYLITILLFSMTFISCTEDDYSCKTNNDCKNDKVCVKTECVVDIDSNLMFDGIANQDFIDGYRYDENGEKAGIQITISAKAKNLEPDTEITLMFEGDDSSKVTQTLNVLSDGSSSVSFKEFTLKDGENKLVLLAKNKNASVVEAKVTITAEELVLNITSPVVDLLTSNDKDSAMHYIQEDVKVDVKGVAVENLVSVKLTLFKVVDGLDDVRKSIYTATPENGQVLFENVSFPEGKWKLVASIDTLNNITVKSEEVILSAESTGDCNVEILPLTGTQINQEFLLNDPAEGRAITLKATTTCPVGYNIRFVINPGDADESIVAAVLSSENGESVASITHEFPEDKAHNDLPSKIKVEVSEDFNNVQADGGFSDATYYIDTIGPEINVGFPSLNYEFFPNNDSDLNVEGMQFTVSGETVDASSLLKVAVDDGADQEFPGAINEETQKFDTNLLTDDKFVTILGSGNHTLKFKALDNRGNETTVEVPVRVYLENINLNITTVATKNIPNDSILKLNKSDDADTNVDNMQFVVEGLSEGLDEGRVIGLFIDDTKVLESNIAADGKLSFNLNTADLGLADGEHDLFIRTIENNGPKSQTVKLFVSNTKPVLLLTGFTDGDYTNQSPVTFNITTTGLSGDDEQVTLKLNGTDLTPVTVDAQGFAVFTDLTLIDGANVINVSAEDFEGNVADPLDFTINFDNEDPNVVITAPVNAAVITRTDDTNNTMAGVQITVNADVDNEIEGTNVKLFLGTNELATGVVDANHKVVFENVTLASSVDNVLKVEVTDKAGNMSDASVTVTVDDGCYNLQFLAPTLDNAKLNDSSFTGTVNVGPIGTNNPAADALSVNLSVGSTNSSSNISAGNASFTGITLSQGSNTLTLSYNVDGSTPCSTAVTVDYDTTAPVVTSLSLIDKDSLAHTLADNASSKLGLLYDTGVELGLQSNIRVSISDIEAGQVMQLKVDGSDTETANVECDNAGENCFALFSSVTLLEGGPYALTFDVKDVNGNDSNTYTVNLSVDITKPVVAFESAFPLSLNTSPAVDQKSTIPGIQYDVVADLSNIQVGDIVRFYIDGNLAKMRLNSDPNTEIDAEHILSGGESTFTFENVTFPLNALDGQGDSIPYIIKLVVVDESGNQTEDVKNNYKVLDGLDVYLGDSQYITRGTKKTNLTSTSIPVAMNRAEQGTMSLSITDEGNVVINTLEDTMDGSVSSTSFTLTDTSDIVSDGRYLLTPKFKDQSNFEYLGTTGYLAVKRTAPSINTFSISQDADSNNILNKVEDGNPALPGFQTSVVITLNNVYLDSDDCDDAKRTLELKQTSANGSVLGSAIVNCDGTVTINASLPESSTSYILYASLIDNFGNNLSNSNQGTVTVDITDPSIGTVVVSTATGSKSFANNIKLLANEDTNSGLAGFQGDLVISTSGNASSVRIDSTPAELNDVRVPVSDSSNFGTITISDGTYSFTVTANDAAGNVSTTTFTGITIDTLIPELSLSMAKTSVSDSDDEDPGTIGIQITATVSGMTNIETGRTVSIQKSDDGVNNWTNLDSFTKTASSSNDLVLTLPVGNYKLRATASDLNAQNGYSSLVDMTVSSSSCSIISVKKGSIDLGAGTNYFNDSDVIAGNVSLTVALTSSCGGHTLTAKKGAVTSNSVVVDSTTETLSIPFSNAEVVTLNFDVDSASASFDIVVDTESPSVTRTSPSVSVVSYVNSGNPSILAPSVIGDSSGDAGAQVTFAVSVSDADGGTVEMISNDGSSDLSQETQDVTGNTFTATFTGKTLSDNKVHSVSFKVTDLAGNSSITQLFTATVDVTNPGNIATLDYDAITDTERRTAELNLNWNQSGTGDDNNTGNVAKYVIKYSQTSFDDSTFEGLTGHEELTINNPGGTATFQQAITNLVFHKNYTIGVRAYDELGNASNVIITTTEMDLNLLDTELNTSSFNAGDSVYTIKAVGDINDDGHNDFVVTQAFFSGVGAVHIYYGTGTGTLSAPQLIQAPVDDWGGFGLSVTSGDFNGDNKADLFIGSVYSNKYDCNSGENTCTAGVVYVYYNQGSGTSIDDTEYILIENTDLKSNLTDWSYGEFGMSIDFIGKVNSDSTYGSIIVGQSHSTNGGRAFIVQGRLDTSSNIDVANDTGNTIELAHDFGTIGVFGQSVSGLGDINKDGNVDVAVGDRTSKKVAVFYLEDNAFTNPVLTAKLDNSGDPTVFSNAGDNYGLNIVGDIDLNNDGNKDLIVAAATTGVYVYYGDGNVFTDSSSFIKINLVSGQTSWNNNLDVADFNGDGKIDIVIGADTKLNIYLSKTDNFTTGVQPDIILDATSDFEPDFTGTLKSAGFDANEDGVDDFIVCDLGTVKCFIKY